MNEVSFHTKLKWREMSIILSITVAELEVKLTSNIKQSNVGDKVRKLFKISCKLNRPNINIQRQNAMAFKLTLKNYLKL